MTAHLGWSLATTAETCGGDLHGPADLTIGRIGTDSRHVEPGELFVAVAGESYDGHEFAADALVSGAAAVVVDAASGVEATPRIVVADTLAALRDLAAKRRAELTAPVVAITGSSGKTSTKDLLAAALPGAWASPRSFNNEVGVPLTVLQTPDDCRYLVVEVGSRGVGHIDWLMPAVRPDVAVITNLGVVHLETFGTEERLADAKWELAAGLESGGTRVLPAGEPRLNRRHGGPVLTFGEEPGADVRFADVVLDGAGRPSLTLHTPQGTRAVRLAMAGRHQAANAAAAVAAGLALGVDLDTLVAGLERAAGSPWRMEIHRGSVTIVNDAYNANPDSVEAALRTVAELPGRHIAVLGRMAELGPVEAAEHQRIGRLVAELGYAAVVVVGDDAGIAAGSGRLARPVPDAATADAVLRDYLRDGDVVLVKASRAVGLETLAIGLIEEYAP
jgi:UDP-N-acetylmuramoyl-tripeptide--D-alanyl-D-alanine ligase